MISCTSYRAILELEAGLIWSRVSCWKTQHNNTTKLTSYWCTTVPKFSQWMAHYTNRSVHSD